MQTFKKLPMQAPNRNTKTAAVKGCILSPQRLLSPSCHRMDIAAEEPRALQQAFDGFAFVVLSKLNNALLL
jgi:hypothetical protein